MFALLLGSTFWFVGGVGFIASLASGWTLFAPFAAALILFGIGITVYGIVELVRG